MCSTISAVSLQIEIEATFPFERFQEAIARAEQSNRRGKVLVMVGEHHAESRDDKSINSGDRMSSDATSEPVHGIRVMNSEFPVYGQPLAVAPGIWWLRLPLHGSLDHVNVYCIEDQDGMTLVDCGSYLAAIEAIYKRLAELGSPFDRKVHRVIVTHYHPDHIWHGGILCRERG